MTWFLSREEAEALLARIERNPDYTYAVVMNGCGPGWGVVVRDADDNLISEAYTPGEDE